MKSVEIKMVYKVFLLLLSGILGFVYLISININDFGVVEAAPLEALDNPINLHTTDAITQTIYLPVVLRPAIRAIRGEGILFVSDRAVADSFDIYRMDLDGQNVQRLTTLEIPSHGSYQHQFLPRWSPNGEQIAFQTDNRLYTMSGDGSQLDVLFYSPEFRIDGIPAWSPDSMWIAFYLSECRGYECGSFVQLGVYVINVKTGEEHLIPYYNSDSNARLQWMPDSESLIGVRDYGFGNPGLVRYYVDGTQNNFLTDYFVNEISVAENGQQLAFVAFYSAYTADIDGTNVQQIFAADFTNQIFAFDIVWHPNSQQVAYALTSNGATRHQLFVANKDGSGDYELTPHDQKRKKLLGWTPDGSQVIYMSDINRIYKYEDIYKIGVNGQNPINLTPDSPTDDVAGDYRVE